MCSENCCHRDSTHPVNTPSASIRNQGVPIRMTERTGRVSSTHPTMSGIAGHLTFFCLVALAVVVATEAGNAPIMVHPGRHVCMQEESVPSQRTQVESYCLPVYKKHLTVCERGGVKQLCTSFRVMYKTAYRERLVNDVQTRMVYACCPGWTQAQAGDNGCMQPICGGGCEQGGTCLQPGLCRCPPGWTGPRCEADLDECANTTLSGCHHKCVNTAGSYRCQCEEGFELQDDGRSCEFCLSCVPEYNNVRNDYHALEKKITHLEQDKEDLKRGLARMEEEYKKSFMTLRADMEFMMADMAVQREEREEIRMSIERQQIEDTQREEEISNEILEAKPASISHYPPGRQHGYQGGPGWDGRLASLSQQIALLEERLHDCTCDTSRTRRRGPPGL